MKKKRLLVVVLALIALIPAYAVLNEKDLSQTLSVLRYELRSAWSRRCPCSGMNCVPPGRRPRNGPSGR